MRVLRPVAPDQPAKDMSRNEDFDNATWDDPDFERLSADAALLYIWSWTNTLCGMAGMYKVSHKGMTRSKVTLRRIPAALDELEAERFTYYRDDVLWVRARVKRLRARTPQMAKSVEKDLMKIPVGHPLVAMFADEYGHHKWLEGTFKSLIAEGRLNLKKTPVGIDVF